MRVVTGQEMAAIDAKAIAEGMPAAALMESAGAAVADMASVMCQGNLTGKRIHVLCGLGNNGGDGFVVARRLINAGARVRVSICGTPEKLQGEAANFYQVLTNMGFQPSIVREVNERFVLTLGLADLIVDALLGTGINGAPRSPLDQVISAINEVDRPILSVDIPSGVNADSGEVLGAAVRADRTVTFGLPKLGLLLYPGASYVGKVSIADIGFSKVCLGAKDDAWPIRYQLRLELIREWCLPRLVNTHKGDYGRLLVVAGAAGMIGAGALTTTSALRSGAGLVTWAGPTSLWPVMATKVTEATTLGLPEGASPGYLGAAALGLVQDRLAGADCLAIGPGLGRLPQTQALVRSVCLSSLVPVVIDADGLHALASDSAGVIEQRREGAVPWILTPHPGEAAALLNCSISDVEDERIVAATTIAEEYSAVVVLKGVPTVVASPNGQVIYLNSTGNPGMATGGSGDVLTGLIAALAGQGMEPIKAAAAGVFIHGLAGDLAAGAKGEAGLVAGDLPLFLPQAFKAVFEQNRGDKG